MKAISQGNAFGADISAGFQYEPLQNVATPIRTNMKTAISRYRFVELVLSMDDRNMILIPIEQGSTNPIKPKTNGRIIVA